MEKWVCRRCRTYKFVGDGKIPQCSKCAYPMERPKEASSRDPRVLNANDMLAAAFPDGIAGYEEV